MLLASTDIVRVVTSTTCAIDVHASWVDLVVSTATATPTPTNTSITTATTTTVVAAPASGGVRKVKMLRVRNKHATASCTVTIEILSGATVIEIDKRSLGPSSTLIVGEDGNVLPLPVGGTQTPPWHGKVYGAYGGCDPGLMMVAQHGAIISATPTNIGVSVARCSLFVPPADIVVNRIRFFGVGITTAVYRVAIYRWSDLARLTAELPITTAAATWGSVGSALNLTLSKDVPYFIACSVNAVGTTAGLLGQGTTVAATTGQIGVAPTAWPGNLLPTNGYINGGLFQFAVSTGALPNPAATPAAQAAWTGGMPAFWLDSADV